MEGKVLEIPLLLSFKKGELLYDYQSSLEKIEHLISSGNYTELMISLESINVTSSTSFVSFARGVQDLVNCCYIASSDVGIVGQSYISSLCDYNVLRLNKNHVINYLAGAIDIKVRQPSYVVTNAITIYELEKHYMSLRRTFHALFDDMGFDGVIITGNIYQPNIILEHGQYLRQSKLYSDIFDPVPPSLYKELRDESMSCEKKYDIVGCEKRTRKNESQTFMSTDTKVKEVDKPTNKKLKVIEL